MSRALLVTGATGKQGGAVISALLAAKSNYRILAVTRNAASPSAAKLAAKSPTISLIQGNLDDPESLFVKAREAVKGPVWGVFSVQGVGHDEERQGKALVDAALNHGVKFFVYSSADRGGPARSFDNPTNVPHFKSKHNIEKHLVDKSAAAAAAAGDQSKKMGWAILRPVAFMDNFAPGFFGKAFNAMWRVGIPSKRPLQLIATEDVGEAAASVLADPEAFDGKALALAGDELTHEQMRSVFREKTGSEAPDTWGLVGRMLLWMSSEMGTMFNFFDKEGFGADVEELRKLYPGARTLGMWLEEKEKKSV